MSEYLNVVFAKEFDGKMYVEADRYTKVTCLLQEEKRKNEELQQKIEKYKRTVSVLASKDAENSGLFDLDFDETEELPFQDEQYEEDYIAELEEQHHNDLIKICRLSDTIDTLVDKLANLRKQMGLV